MAQENWKVETECEAPSEGQVFCTNNCGYFGSPATMNMCCKCYEDLVRLHPDGEPKTTLDVSTVNSDLSGPIAGKVSDSHDIVKSKIENPIPASLQTFQVGAATIEAAGCAQFQPSKLINRCFMCRRKVGLTGFKCRCGDVFCGSHRYSEEHGCSFDYKSAGRDAIAKANPLIKAEKIQKI